MFNVYPPVFLLRMLIAVGVGGAFVLLQWMRSRERSRLTSAVCAVLIVVPFYLAAVAAATSGAGGIYGVGLFCALPVSAGMLTTMLYGWNRKISLGESILLSLISVATLGVGLLIVAIEGVVCLMMALPLAIPLAMGGGMLGYLVLHLLGRDHPQMATLLLLIFLAPSGTMEFERRHPAAPPLFAVTTSLDIPAPPEAVWQATIAPSRLERPDSLAFRAGIAYPKGAWIVGSGPGATRYCDFSTGRLVEPVREWREPELLRFAVTQNPEPMEEWTPWAHIHPAHLEGFLVSRQGQFRLNPIPGGTRLEATTWYQHGLYPATYWRWWSDAIIHRVHEVVLGHIRDTVR